MEDEKLSKKYEEASFLLIWALIVDFSEIKRREKAQRKAEEKAVKTAEKKKVNWFKAVLSLNQHQNEPVEKKKDEEEEIDPTVWWRSFFLASKQLMNRNTLRIEESSCKSMKQAERMHIHTSSTSPFQSQSSSKSTLTSKEQKS